MYHSFSETVTRSLTSRACAALSTPAPAPLKLSLEGWFEISVMLPTEAERLYANGGVHANGAYDSRRKAMSLLNNREPWPFETI